MSGCKVRTLVLGSQSFLDSGTKVGIQYIAEGLSKNGWQVDYISNASSPFDMLSASRRSRFKRVWKGHQDVKGLRVNDNLTEYAFRSPYPTVKEILRLDVQIRLYGVLAPDHIRKTVYDICIHDASLTALFLPLVKAKHFVYRLNDLPSGFSFVIHPKVISVLDRLLEVGRYDEIWAVSSPLAEYAVAKNPGNKVDILPNGVDLKPEYLPFSQRTPRSAVFVGNIFPWIDIELVDKTAAFIPEWVIDFYGPLRTRWVVSSPNVRYKGILERDKVASELRKYCVGLIPFKEVASRMHTVERPLKFYEYMTSGLGIASTEVGSLRHGMGERAFYGSTPQSFSEAIKKAGEAASKTTYEEILSFSEEHSWEGILKNMTARLEAMRIKSCKSSADKIT